MGRLNKTGLKNLLNNKKLPSKQFSSTKAIKTMKRQKGFSVDISNGFSIAVTTLKALLILENGTTMFGNYLRQLEYNLNNHVAYKSDLAIIEKLLSEQQQTLENLGENTSFDTSTALMDESGIKKDKTIIVNPK